MLDTYVTISVPSGNRVCKLDEVKWIFERKDWGSNDTPANTHVFQENPRQEVYSLTI